MNKKLRNSFYRAGPDLRGTGLIPGTLWRDYGLAFTLNMDSLYKFSTKIANFMEYVPKDQLILKKMVKRWINQVTQYVPADTGRLRNSVRWHYSESGNPVVNWKRWRDKGKSGAFNVAYHNWNVPAAQWNPPASHQFGRKYTKVTKDGVSISGRKPKAIPTPKATDHWTYVVSPAYMSVRGTGSGEWKSYTEYTKRLIVLDAWRKATKG